MWQRLSHREDLVPPASLAAWLGPRAWVLAKGWGKEGYVAIKPTAQSLSCLPLHGTGRILIPKSLSGGHHQGCPATLHWTGARSQLLC